MMASSFESLFMRATSDDGTFRSFPYQRRLAEAETLPTVLSVPTGAGKTAAVITAWLWRRRCNPHATPRRLVYTLPMRVLVEQTADVARAILRRLGVLYEGPPDPAVPGVRVATLMGGQVDEDWWLEPERETILVGTVDMLLSRALNRGYGLSRYRWPVDFGLLNSDALWVFDEVQLLGVSLYTGMQLQAMRRLLGTFGPTHTLWCSATVDPSALRTVDHPAPRPEEMLMLGDDDRDNELLRRRLTARKTLRRLASGKARRGGTRPPEAELARTILDAHRPGTRTLVVLNTVERAQRLYAEVKRLLEGRRSAPQAKLIHSRFRPPDRAALQRWLVSDIKEGEPGRIAVTTQVVEAGVDVSASTLFTELAPWFSLVQRLGRCNRYGEMAEGAQVFWIDLGEKEVMPYEPQALAEARRLLHDLEGADVSPQGLEGVQRAPARGDAPLVAHVLRKRDVLGLFDTTPDLSGQHLDVSRFIREGTDLDALVFWREWGEGNPPATLPAPSRDELCPVPVYEVRAFIEQPDRAAWLWDPLANSGTGGWLRARTAELRPGQIILLSSSDGGYSTEAGWFREARGPVQTIEAGPPTRSQPSQDAADDDRETTAPERWITLQDHTLHVVSEVEGMLRGLTDLKLGQAAEQALRTAAAYHDVGKAHPEFQSPIVTAAPNGERQRLSRCVWAKAPTLGQRSRRPFRHELASALAYLQTLSHEQFTDDWVHVVAFLIAGHHGKVRLAIRSLPGEKPPDAKGRRFAQGIWDEDRLPPVTIAGLVHLPPLVLKLSVMEMGLSLDGGFPTPSWSDRMLALRDAPQWGPFRLAFLEALLRAADVRASMREKASPNLADEGGASECLGLN